MPFGSESDVEALSLLNDHMMPSPSEALLAALGSCLSVSIQANAVARAIPIRWLVIELEGDIDFAALWGTGDLGFKGLGFETISISVQIEADTPPRCPQNAARSCGAMVTRRQCSVYSDRSRRRFGLTQDRYLCPVMWGWSRSISLGGLERWEKAYT